MCRLLLARSSRPFPTEPLLRRFAAACAESPEYQGHGWGVASFERGNWRVHRELDPIWDSETLDQGSTRFLVAHARSAFRDEGIELDNNMPFHSGGQVFVFNGELHGVRIPSEGATGAAKIFHLIRRLTGDPGTAFARVARILPQRSEYVRAANMILTDGRQVHLASQFSESPDYFTLHHRRGHPEILCSVPLGEGFQPIPNGTVRTLPALEPLEASCGS